METAGRIVRRTPHAVAFAAVLALLAFLALPAPGGAAGVIQDDARFFSPAAVASATQRSQQVQQATGKTIALRTVATIGSKDDAAASAAADKVFQELQLNGVLIYVVKDAGKLVLKVGQDTRQLVPVAEETTIRNAMLTRFNAKDFDGGLPTGLDALDRDLRAGAATTNGGSRGPRPRRARPRHPSRRGAAVSRWGSSSACCRWCSSAWRSSSSRGGGAAAGRAVSWAARAAGRTRRAAPAMAARDTAGAAAMAVTTAAGMARTRAAVVPASGPARRWAGWAAWWPAA